MPSHGVTPRPDAVSLGEAFRVWARIALLSFGGPAGQIAVMHRILVEEKRWIGERRFLHAINYCVLLPGRQGGRLFRCVHGDHQLDGCRSGVRTHRRVRRLATSLARALVTCAVLLDSSGCSAATRTIAATDPSSPLRLVRTIALPDVKGRIDHLAIDLAHHRLFVAEYANGTVDVIDLDAGKVVDRITGLKEPQGLGVTLDGAELVVASGDGTVRFYATTDRRPLGKITVGEDADNVRIDARQGHVVVGYGDGALAVIDPATRTVIARVALPAHPEGFRLSGADAIVNIPDKGMIVVADLDDGRMTASWRTGLHRLNFPLALDPAGRWFAAAYRLPAALEMRDRATGAVMSSRSACGDADDLFVDGARLYLVCGAGHVGVMSTDGSPAGAVSVETGAGARTGLFVPELRTLFVAKPARGAPAAILMLEPR